jgi:hypothetical protein
MNAAEFEAKYIGQAKRVGSLILFRANDALGMLDECFESGLPFLGVEAFRLFDDGGIQPSMEFSNVSFGKIESRDGVLQVTSFERKLQSAWEEAKSIRDATKDLIRQGALSGYDWFEISINDPASGELIFFRVADAGNWPGQI